MFDISFFRNNPLPFYTLAHELYPGRYRPTISHSFVRLLSDKGLLLKLFTQNIDCLDREAGVPDDKIVEAHGSFALQRCIECKTPYPEDMMKQAVSKRVVPHCLTPQCNGLVKPDIVFFGEQLPENFHRNRSLPSTADLCIVMGTSLTVQPFASLPNFCSEEVPRVLINLERVGGLGTRADDVLVLGDCDAGVRKLAAALEWEEELERVWQETKREPNDKTEISDTPKKSKDENLDDQITQLSKEVDESLKIQDEHTSWLREHLAEKGEERSNANAAVSPAKSVAMMQLKADTSNVTDKESPEARTPPESGFNPPPEPNKDSLAKTPLTGIGKPSL